MYISDEAARVFVSVITIWPFLERPFHRVI